MGRGGGGDKLLLSCYYCYYNKLFLGLYSVASTVFQDYNSKYIFLYKKNGLIFDNLKHKFYTCLMNKIIRRIKIKMRGGGVAIYISTFKHYIFFIMMPLLGGTLRTWFLKKSTKIAKMCTLFLYDLYYCCEKIFNFVSKKINGCSICCR